jgi:putative ABC transport system permease protein
MVIRANFKEALRSLFSSKQRSILALIGIIIGIGSVIGMVSIGGIVQLETMKQFRDMGVDVVTIRKGSEAGPTGHSGGMDSGFSLADVADLPLSVASFVEVAPFSQGGSDFTAKEKKEYLSVFGVTASFFSINRLKIASGRAVTDLDRHTPFCVIGSETADLLRQTGRKELIGSEIKLATHIFTIAGVMASVPGGGSMRPPNLNKAVLIHATTASRAYPASKVTSIIARVRQGTDVRALKGQIHAYFSARDKRLNVEVQTAEELIESMEKQMRLFTLLLGAIGSIALIVGGVGVMNVMLVSVSERRKEIGIRRALGAHREDVQVQFIIESVVLCLAGGLIGILMGIAISYLFAYFTGWQFMLSVNAVMLGIGVSSAVGVFFGYYPARQASRLDPITALRGE